MATTELMTQTEAPLCVADDEGAANVSSLVRLAIERGVEVEVLERLVALQERVTERNARAAFFEAVASFQDECPEISKSRKADIATKSGAKFSYTYAPLEEITRTIRPALRKHGLSYSWDVSSDGGKVMTVVCVLRHIDGHEERATFPVPVESGGRMSDAQANGGALTYGKRQSLTSVLGLTTADDDRDGAGGKKQPDPISMQQADAIDALLHETGSDRAKFFKWLGVESIADMNAEHYKSAVTALEEKKGRKA